MEQQPTPPVIQPQNEDEVTLRDILNTLRGVLMHWPILAASMLVGLAIAFVVNRYSKDTYKISAQVSIEEADNPLADAQGALSIGFSFGGSNGILETRMAVLESYAHNSRVARKLGWEIQHFTEGRLSRNEVYPQELFAVEFDPTHVQALGLEFDIELQEDGFLLSAEQLGELAPYSYEQAAVENDLKLPEEFLLEETQHQWNEWIESDLYRFKLTKGKEIDGEDSYTSFKFSFQSFDAIAEWGMKNLLLSLDEKNNTSSLLDLSMEGHNRLQIADYLNTSIEELQRYELQQKNLMAINTIEFIDGQLIQIESALRNSEEALEEFRANNLIVDLSAESEQMLEYFIELEQERSQLNLQRSFYRYVLEFLQSKQTYSGLSLPTLSSFNDALVAQLAEQLIESSVQLEKYRYSLEGTNPDHY